MKDFSLRAKIVMILVCLGLVAVCTFSIYTYRRAVSLAVKAGREDAKELIDRSTEMFMVSTRKFHEDFIRTQNDPAEQKRILDDWNRTIFAVDEAVIHDFGDNAPRAMLIGDEKLFGYKPLAKKGNTAIQIPFEKRAAEKIAGGETYIEEQDKNMLRLAVPLPSQAHPGCAECHFSVIEGPQADMSRNIVLGTLNAYVPLGERMKEAKAQALNAIIFLVVLFAVLIGAVLFFINKSLYRPLTRIVDQLRGAAGLVFSSSGEIAESSQMLAKSTSEQAASLEETNASLEEISSMIKQNADNAGEAEGLMKNINGIVFETNQSMKALCEAMNTVSEASGKTGKIIKTIDEIAFQTNLLALNAAVEAARAGEAGAGFAVVADEVRNLAQRAAEAAKDSQALIEENQANIQTGTDLAEKTDGSFGNVQESTEKISSLISEIAEASKQQANGIDQISKATVEMDKIVQQNSSTAEESSGSSEEMNSQAGILNKIVVNLEKLVGSGKTGSAGTPVRNKTKAVSRPSTKEKKPDHAALKKAEELIPFDEDEFSDF